MRHRARVSLRRRCRSSSMAVGFRRRTSCSAISTPRAGVNPAPTRSEKAWSILIGLCVARSWEGGTNDVPSGQRPWLPEELLCTETPPVLCSAHIVRGRGSLSQSGNWRTGSLNDVRYCHRGTAVLCTNDPGEVTPNDRHPDQDPAFLLGKCPPFHGHGIEARTVHECSEGYEHDSL